MKKFFFWVLYQFCQKNLNFGCAKVPGFNDLKRCRTRQYERLLRSLNRGRFRISPNQIFLKGLVLVWSPFFLYSEENVENFYMDAAKNRIKFWDQQAQCLDWFQPWNQTLQWNPPHAQWFVGGKLNASYNCLDRHLTTSVKDKMAIYWEGERGDERKLTYEDLYREVNKFSNVLKSLGVQKGETVAIFLPMIPEAIISMLSCARIGAIHTVVFGGFSAEALKDRMKDADAKILITADGGFRRGKIIPLKEIADEALKEMPEVQKVIVLKHAGQTIEMKKSRDCLYAELMKEASEECLPEPMDAEDPLYILYTSGTTGKPKGVVHTTGGYMVSVTKTMQWVFNPQDHDIYWCTADIGWVTGHSYIVYGPLSNGCTQFIYEGAPDFPEKNRFWKLLEKYHVSILYTAPTLIRSFMKWGEEWLQGIDLSSLRLLGSVGEPINPEVWMWYYNHVGQKRCPIVDTWWQTETGSIMIAPIPGKIPLKPGSATVPLPGIDVQVIDEQGQPNTSGFLMITSPWPSMMRGIHKDPTRYKETYWNHSNGYYFTGDGAQKDQDGYYWLTGRIDDVMNVAGHRLGTMEIESALLEHQSIAEAAVIGISHPIKGQAIVAFVVLKDSVMNQNHLESEIKNHVAKKIGAIARPERVILICDLPKTRSGKIMRRLLRDIAEGRVASDLSTLSDPSVVDELKKKYQEE